MIATDKIRVLVVDDSVVVRQVISDALRSDPAIEVIGMAQNGRVALEKLATLTPDVITLDLEMPEMDGLTTLLELRKRHNKIPVVVFSTLTERGASATLEALARGATDYVCKPSGQRSIQATMQRIQAELLPKIHALHTRARPGAPRAPATVGVLQATGPLPPVQLIVIGVSTGGPGALAEIIPRLPATLVPPIVIVQHMPAVFTRVLGQRLNASSPLAVREAVHQEPLESGHVYIAPGDYHVRVAGGPRAAWLMLDQGTAENGCRPAVDPLFRSAAQVFGSGALALVLTGLGQDGTKGAALIRKAGGAVWVQDEASSTVWSMPSSVVQAGLATRVLALANIPAALAQLGQNVARMAAPPAGSRRTEP